MTESKTPSAYMKNPTPSKPYVTIEHRPLLGVPEAAALTGLDEKAIRLVIRQGELIARYAGSSTKRIRRRDLDDDLLSARTAAMMARPPHGSNESCGGRFVKHN